LSPFERTKFLRSNKRIDDALRSIAMPLWIKHHHWPDTLKTWGGHGFEVAVQESPNDNREVFIGDGLFASYEGYALTLHAPREHGDDVVILEPIVFEAFLEFAQRCGAWTVMAVRWAETTTRGVGKRRFEPT
jgi:hypothetical protein